MIIIKERLAVFASDTRTSIAKILAFAERVGYDEPVSHGP
jgi:hypothetical protein